MPIFHNHSLIFVHIPKNAGKSIEAAFLGPRAPDAGKRNTLNAAAKFLLRKTSRSEPRNNLLGSLDYTFAAQHMTWHEMTSLGLIGVHNCSNYIPFAVIRNPYDRAVSSIFHHYAAQLKSGLRQINTPDDFTRALQEWLKEPPRDHNHIAHKRNQFDFLTSDGQTLAISELIHYENLETELTNFCMQHGLVNVKLGWEGRNNRNRNYRDYISDEGRHLLRTHYGKDIDNLKYTY